MQNKTYDEIWKDIITVAGEFLNSVDDSVKKVVEPTIIYERKKIIFKEYNRLKSEFRRNYYKGNKESLLCHHKIASCYCNALINKKIVAFDLTSDELTKEMISEVCFINYKIAFFTGLSIVKTFLCDYYYKDNTIGENEKKHGIELVLNHTFSFPETSDTHDDFVDGIIKMLGMQDLQDDRFDILGFSYIYFLIEEHNKQVIKYKYLSNIGR